MIITDPRQLPHVKERAIVINVDTEVVTSLAIASALAHADMPVLLVNCTPGAASIPFFQTLRDNWSFDYLELPLNPHGTTLDYLFSTLDADVLLLLDSDAELRMSRPVDRARQAFNLPYVFGSGYWHQYDWLDYEASLQPGRSIYRERPWIPFSMFRVSHMREALAAGISFNEVRTNDPALVAGWGIPREMLTDGPAEFGISDTGGEMYHWNVARGRRFDGPNVMAVYDEVNHYHGVTRMQLTPGTSNATPLDAIENEALQRLAEAYPTYFGGFAAAVRAVQSALVG